MFLPHVGAFVEALGHFFGQVLPVPPVVQPRQPSHEWLLPRGA
jgi:hypothetical protein